MGLSEEAISIGIKVDGRGVHFIEEMPGWTKKDIFWVAQRLIGNIKVRRAEAELGDAKPQPS
jgi:hypothetical protein